MTQPKRLGNNTCAKSSRKGNIFTTLEIPNVTLQSLHSNLKYVAVLYLDTNLCLQKVSSNGLIFFVYFRLFCRIQFKHKLIKALIACLGLEPRMEGAHESTELGGTLPKSVFVRQLNKIICNCSVTRLGDLLNFRQLFKACGKNYFDQIAHIYW